MRPLALIFDWDNTLVNTWGVIREALNTTFEAFDKPLWSLDETRARVRNSTRDSFPVIFGDKWRDAADVFYGRYAEIHKEKLEMAADADAMLQSLTQSGFYLAVVSNKRGDYLRAEAEHLDWSRHFGAIVGATDAKRDKPAPDPIEMALADSGIEPGARVWFVGDADIDLQCAHQAGCHPVLLRAAPPGKTEFPDWPPAQHFSDCMALCKFIDNL